MRSSDTYSCWTPRATSSAWPNTPDARAKVLTVTPAEVDLANRANAVVEKVDHNYFATLDEVRPGPLADAHPADPRA